VNHELTPINANDESDARSALLVGHTALRAPALSYHGIIQPLIWPEGGVQEFARAIMNHYGPSHFKGDTQAKQVLSAQYD